MQGTVREYRGRIHAGERLHDAMGEARVLRWDYHPISGSYLNPFFKVERCLRIRQQTHAAETSVKIKLVVTQIFCDGEQNPNLSLWRVKITNAVIVVHHFGCPMKDKQV